MPKPIALEIDDDQSVAPVQHGGDVRFRGTIREARPVQVGGALTVDGHVEATRLSVSGAASITGGFTATQSGHRTVGGDLHCNFMRGVNVMVRGDVHVQTEMANSRVTCAGRIEMPDAVLHGGDTAANGGIVCRALGHADGRWTIVEAGEGRTLRLLTASIDKQIENRRQEAEIMRSSIEPLMANMKALSPQQKEKATEMLFQATELDEATTSLAAAFELRKRRTQDAARPRIAVSGRVHAGVVVQFEAVEAVITTPIDGPLTLTCRKTDGITEIVVIDTTSGAARVLPTRPREVVAAAA